MVGESWVDWWRTSYPISMWPKLLVVVLLVSASPGAVATDTVAKHAGLYPYVGPPPLVPLTESERAEIADGEPVYKHVSFGGGGRGVAVFRVNAPPHVIWSVISDFASYPQWVDGVEEASIYQQQGDDIFVCFGVRHWLVGRYAYYVQHTFFATLGWGTWKLDRTRTSDFEETVGFWRVASVPEQPGVSDVTYSASLRLKTWIPEFIETSHRMGERTIRGKVCALNRILTPVGKSRTVAMERQ